MALKAETQTTSGLRYRSPRKCKGSNAAPSLGSRSCKGLCNLDAKIPTILGHQGTIVTFGSEQWPRDLPHPRGHGRIIWHWRCTLEELRQGRQTPFPHHPYTTSTTTIGRTAQIAGSSVRHFQRLTGLLPEWHLTSGLALCCSRVWPGFNTGYDLIRDSRGGPFHFSH